MLALVANSASCVAVGAVMTGVLVLLQPSRTIRNNEMTRGARIAG